MRRHKQALIKRAVGSGIGTDLLSASGNGLPEGNRLDQIRSSRKISACRRDAAAAILDQTACHEIGADRRRLDCFRKLSVAVVCEHDNVLPNRAHKRDRFAHPVNRDRIAPCISSRPLQIDHPDRRILG